MCCLDCCELFCYFTCTFLLHTLVLLKKQFYWAEPQAYTGVTQAFLESRAELDFFLLGNAVLFRLPIPSCYLVLYSLRASNCNAVSKADQLQSFAW